MDNATDLKKNYLEFSCQDRRNNLDIFIINGIFFKIFKDKPVVKVQLRYIRHYMLIFHMKSLL